MGLEDLGFSARSDGANWAGPLLVNLGLGFRVSQTLCLQIVSKLGGDCIEAAQTAWTPERCLPQSNLRVSNTLPQA